MIIIFIDEYLKQKFIYFESFVRNQQFTTESCQKKQKFGFFGCGHFINLLQISNKIIKNTKKILVFGYGFEYEG